MSSATILIDDDEPAKLSLLTHLLRPVYQVRAANSGENQLRMAMREPAKCAHVSIVMLPPGREPT